MTAVVATRAGEALHVVARVGGECFAFPASAVDEVIDTPPVEWVPTAPAGMLGQMAHRGRVVAVWDAGWAFRVPRTEGAGAALVLRDGPRRMALVVDDVMDVARIATADLHAVPGGADADGVLSAVCLTRPARDVLVSVVRVDALAALVWSAGPAPDGRLP